MNTHSHGGGYNNFVYFCLKNNVTVFQPLIVSYQFRTVILKLSNTLTVIVRYSSSQSAGFFL